MNQVGRDKCSMSVSQGPTLNACMRLDQSCNHAGLLSGPGQAEVFVVPQVTGLGRIF
jgi:hypothetical protein